MIAAHDHGDHFDIGSIPLLVNEKTNTLLIGPGSVIEASKKMGINESKLIKPCTSSFDRLYVAKIRGECSSLGPKINYQWHINLIVSANTDIKSLKEDGCIAQKNIKFVYRHYYKDYFLKGVEVV